MLPPIVYVAAFFTPIRSFRADLGHIVSLAIGLVLATTVAVAGIALALVPGMTWPIAIALGAIVSPPDEVAAIAVMERLAVPRRLIGLLQGESLLNDATALTVYRVALGAAVAGTPLLSMLVPVGMCMMVEMASSNTLIQSIVPDRLRGRVMAVYSMMFMGMAPFGSLFAGALADRVGAPVTLTIGAIVCLGGAAIFGLRLPSLRVQARELIVAQTVAGGDPPQEMTAREVS